MTENPFAPLQLHRRHTASTVQTRRAGVVVSLTLVVSVLGAFTTPAAAQPRTQPNGLNWGELAMLPEYCKDAAGIVYGDRYFNRSPNAPRWEAVMGLDFWHVHHYCYALNNLRRASFTANPTDKRFLLQKVRGDYGYMINNSRPDMVLMPEILTRMGDVQNMLGDVGAAYVAYETAMARKPDYWPAYKSAADMFLKAGVKPRGLEILQRGISANPGSPELRDSYKAAGGNLALLPPVPPPAPPARPEASASTADVPQSQAPSPPPPAAPASSASSP